MYSYVYICHKEKINKDVYERLEDLKVAARKHIDTSMAFPAYIVHDGKTIAKHKQILNWAKHGEDLIFNVNI